MAGGSTIINITPANLFFRQKIFESRLIVVDQKSEGKNQTYQKSTNINQKTEIRNQTSTHSTTYSEIRKRISTLKNEIQKPQRNREIIQVEDNLALAHPIYSQAVTTGYVRQMNRLTTMFGEQMTGSKLYKGFEKASLVMGWKESTKANYWASLLSARKALEISVTEADRKVKTVYQRAANVAPVGEIAPMMPWHLNNMWMKNNSPEVVAIAISYLLGQRLSDMCKLQSENVKRSIDGALTNGGLAIILPFPPR